MNDEMNKKVEIKVIDHSASISSDFFMTLDNLERILNEKKKLRDQFIIEQKVNERLIKSDRIDYTLYLKQIYSL